MLLLNRIAGLIAIAALVAALWVLLVPEFYSDERTLAELRANRDGLFSAFLPFFFLTPVIAMVLGVIAGTVSRIFWRRSPWSDACLMAWVYIIIPLYPLSAFVLAASHLSFDFAANEPELHAANQSELQIVHVSGISIYDGYAVKLKELVPLQRNARLSGTYLANGRSIWNLSVFSSVRSSRIFTSESEVVSDLHTRGSDLFIIVGSDLLLARPSSETVARLARLPFAGMKLGQRKRSFGAASELLVFGNDGNQSFVYELNPDGSYAKLMDGEGQIVGAAGCHDRTLVAFDTRVLVLQPGYNPTIEFQAPGSDKITSILVHHTTIHGSGQCTLLVATANAIYAVQDGLATMLILGLGGQLSADENQDAGFDVIDAPRNSIVGVTFIFI